MINHEVVYERNLAGSYMKIAAGNVSKFDERMMLRGKLRGVLPVEQCFVNGQMWYWYRISGMQSLDTHCRVKQVDIGLVEKVILSICDELEVLEWNLLNPNCLILDPEYIFIHNINEEIIFTMYPGSREEIGQQFQQLMEFFLTRIDHKDMQAVHAVYALYEKALDETYSLMDLRDILTAQKNEAAKEEAAHMCPPDSTKKSERIPETFEYKQAGTKDVFPAAKQREKSDFMEKLIGSLFSRMDALKIPWVKPLKEWMSGSGKSNGDLPGIVYPEDNEPIEQVVIHPTVCLADMQGKARGILWYEGSEQISSIHIRDGGGRIGKSEQSEYRINRDTVSQFHARIFCEGQEYYLEDLNSTNGTYINDEILPFKTSRKLEINDIVRFADVSFRFR